MNGNCLDNSDEFHLVEFKELIDNTRQQLLINKIVYDISSILNEKDEVVIIKIIFCLST